MRTTILSKKYARIGFMLCACSALNACTTADRIANIGKAPEMAKISNPTTDPAYQPVSLPMPAPVKVVKEKNSLWQSDRKTFFEDQRASDVGDIITVTIDIADKAELDNATTGARNGSESASAPALLGLENSLNKVLPEAVDPTNLAELGSTSNSRGSGTIDREEKIEVKLAAFITQLLPNGNMVIHGKQEVLVNYEKRILQVDGVIRPQDISTENTVAYDQIAEARIMYGGEGHLTELQQPRYGQQLYDIIFPF